MRFDLTPEGIGDMVRHKPQPVAEVVFQIADGCGHAKESPNGFLGNYIA